MIAHPHFGKYQILEQLAEGRFSSIYKARLEGIGGFHRLFAIKRLPKALSENKNYMDRLIEEAKLAGLLSHANIVQILDLGRIDERYYIAMEYINGQDLGSVLRKCRSKSITFPLPHALFTVLEALKGLEYAHQRKVLRGGRPIPLNLIHRGISPTNILMSLQGEVKLTDFGLSRAHQTIGPPSNLRLSYRSPEQVQGKAVDFRSDIYALGVVLYEMLCGAHPFLKHNEAQTRQAILAHKLKPPSAVNPDVPFSLEIILEQALAADPEERFQTAAAFKESIEGFFHDSGFIFSHSTLAAFLKGLFPKKSLPKRQKASAQETVPLHKNFPLFDDESEEIPTSLNNIDLLDLPTDTAEYPLATAQPLDSSVSSTSASFGPSSSANDDSTLILRPSPDREPISDWMDQTRVDDNDDHTQARAKLSEEKTNVRAIPPEKQRSAPPQQDATVRLKKPEPPPILAIGSKPKDKYRELPGAQLPLTAQETAPFPLPDYEVSLSGPLPVAPPSKLADPQAGTDLNSKQPLILAAMVLAGLGIGLMIGKNSGENKALESVNPTSATARHLPVLQISGPEGTQIKEGDRVHSIDASGMAEMTLEPDENTLIRITAEGFRPTDYRYTPRENGIRKLILEWKELTPTR
jgi:serine/threonine protein kinase